MNPILLIDFGSTFTKVTAVDLDSETVIGAAAGFTTMQTDINKGLENALGLLQKNGPIDFKERYACSSAAGGLRMAACGLVPELTAEAAKMASLGAGARVIKVYSYKLTNSDIREIDGQKPDIFLLTGGTDGGDTGYILHNAKMLSGCAYDFPIILAGNRSCADECLTLLKNREVFHVSNVMPAFGEIDIAPAQEKIREIFLRQIVFAKGLGKAEKLVSGILMPTPAAMLDAMTLLQKGHGSEGGIGELMCVDLGGATTDVYSVAQGAPQRANTIIKGLPEPFAKRSVEGDIGMRHSIRGIVEAIGEALISELSGLTREKIAETTDILAKQTEKLPDSPELLRLDFALAAAAVRIGIERHAGKIERVFTPSGEAFVQSGKDLRNIKKMIVTGGALIHAESPGEIVRTALAVENPLSLKPRHVSVLADKKYILAAMGLLSQRYPEPAIRIMKKELMEYGASK